MQGYQERVSKGLGYIHIVFNSQSVKGPQINALFAVPKIIALVLGSQHFAADPLVMYSNTT